MNCDAPLAGAYCATCGQRARHGRLEWRDLLRDVNEQLVEGNLPWLHTIARLTVDPGATARDYVAGRRARYVHPLKFAFYGVLIATLLGWGFLDGIPLDRTPDGWRRFLVDNPAVFWLLMSPVPVIALRLAFFGQRYNTVEIWVFVLYLLGLLAPLFLVVNGLEQILRDIGLIGDTSHAVYVLAFIIVIIPVYLMWAVMRFFQAPLHWSLSAGLVALIVTGWVGGAAYFWLAGLR